MLEVYLGSLFVFGSLFYLWLDFRQGKKAIRSKWPTFILFLIIALTPVISLNYFLPQVYLSTPEQKINSGKRKEEGWYLARIKYPFQLAGMDIYELALKTNNKYDSLLDDKIEVTMVIQKKDKPIDIRNFNPEHYYYLGKVYSRPKNN